MIFHDFADIRLFVSNQRPYAPIEYIILVANAIKKYMKKRSINYGEEFSFTDSEFWDLFKVCEK